MKNQKGRQNNQAKKMKKNSILELTKKQVYILCGVSFVIFIAFLGIMVSAVLEMSNLVN